MSSSIADLPIELIELIFGHLTMANDRRRTAQVCKLFNKVIRSQSIRNRNNTLVLGRSLSGKSPFCIFKDWERLPFSKLIISVETWNQFIVKESEFWSVHGHEISEMILYIDNNFNTEKSLVLVSLLSIYFPNLKKLKIDRSWMINSNIGPNVQNTLNCSLPIVELSLFSINSHEVISTVLRCSPYLKKLRIDIDKPELLPKIFPWLESIEASCLDFVKMPLSKLINLPSKVVFGSLTIQVNEKPEMIREFFKRPRVIERLILKRRDNNLDFNYDEEEGENNPEFIYFTREQVEALSGAKSIKDVYLRGVLNFGGSLDLLAQLPEVDSISLNLSCHRPDQLYPFYWSSPDTAKKITEIVHKADSALNYLDGLSSLTNFRVSSDDELSDSTDDEVNTHGLSGDEIQHLIRNCPNLKKLEAETIFADLIGTGGLLPFSSLEKLEFLHIDSAPNITPEALTSAFKFPKLKIFFVPYFSEEPFNQIDAKFLAQNCPNVEYLELRVSSMKKEAIDYLTRNLPYLQTIHIRAKETSLLNEENVKEIEKEFPYLDIISGSFF